MPKILARRSAITRHRSATVILATETWTGTTGAAWPGQWTTAGLNSTTATIQSNQGQLTNPSITYTMGAVAYLSGMTAVADSEYTLDWSVSALAAQNIIFGSRNDGTYGGYEGNNGYRIVVSVGGSTLQVSKDTAGTAAAVSTAVSIPAIIANTTYHMRIRTMGAVISAKIWTGGSEPGSFTVSTTDSSPYSTAGKIMLYTQTQGTAATSYVNYDNLTVTNGL